MKRILAITAIALSLSSCLHSATITGEISGPIANGTDFNVTTLGQVDWAYWDNTGTGLSGAPDNSMSGGTAIASVTTIGGGSPRGSSGSYSAVDFIYTNGTSPTSGTETNIIGVFNSSLGATNVGLSLDITLPTTDAYEVSFWVSAYRANARLRANFGSSPFLYENTITGTVTDSGTPKPTYLYTLIAQADAVNGTDNVLNLDLLATSSLNASSHVAISGAAVSLATVPEPSTASALLGLLALAACCLLRRKHCRR